MKGQIFKMYAPQQAILLPPSVEELIPGNHLVRMVCKLIEELDKRVLERQYRGRGTSAYDPQMLLKVIIYVYTQSVPGVEVKKTISTKPGD